MATRPASKSGRLRRGGPVTLSALAATAMCLLALAAGCSSGSAASPEQPTASTGSGSNLNVSSSNRGGGNDTSGTFTKAFAECMRAHGVPNFPDPNGQAGQLGPDSGVNPRSAQFQAAINGPCLSLAPAAWVSSGKVTK